MTALAAWMAPLWLIGIAVTAAHLALITPPRSRTGWLYLFLLAACWPLAVAWAVAGAILNR